MKHRRQQRSSDIFSSHNWTPRTSYAFLAKRRYPAEFDDVTLAKQGRLERELERTKKTIDSIKAKTIKDIESQRTAIKKAIHVTDEENGEEKQSHDTETNTLFRNIQNANSRTIISKSDFFKSTVSRKDQSLYLSKDRFRQIHEDIKERLSNNEDSVKTEKFKILLRRPSSADMLSRVKAMDPLLRIREVLTPKSDSCIIVTSKRT